METQFLETDGGRVAYEDSQSEGPLTVLISPMGASRSVFRFLTPRLIDAGFRVAAVDLRGHGESTFHFSDYSTAAHSRDVLALVDKLDAGPAFLVGNSYGGGVAVWAAADQPDAVRGIALVGAFVRKAKMNPAMALFMKLAFAGPWGPAAWMSYYPRMYPNRRPPDFAEHLGETRRMWKVPGRFAAFRKLTNTNNDGQESKLAQVKAPTIVIMGDADPDFPNPTEEATFQASALNADHVMVPGGGHHLQADSPDEVAGALIPFLAHCAAGT